MRLIAVILLSLITAYWAGFAIYLLFLPEGSTGASLGVLYGAICLVAGWAYALAAWGTAKRIRGLHVLAIVVAGLGIVFDILAIFVQGTVDVWMLTALGVAAVVLLAQTFPRPVAK
jgi:hypothetical protein